MLALASLVLATAASVAAPAPAQDEPTAGMSGIVLLPDGSPAAGAKWEVHGWGANTERKLEFGEPEDWTDPSGELDAEGRLSTRFDSPQAYQFTLQIELEGYVTAQYRWSRIRPTEVMDIGTVKLRPAGTVTGTIVDSNGKPLTGEAWSVHASEDVEVTFGRPARGARERTSADVKTAKFTIGGLPAGPIELKVHERRLGWSKTHSVTIVAGETVTKDIVLDELEEFADRIVVTVFKGIYHTAPEPASNHIWLVAEDGTRRFATRVDGTSQDWAFDDVGEGTFRVEIDDPRYDPWSEDGVKSGGAVRPRLKGSAALKLDVRDANGDAIDTYQVDLTFENSNWRPNTFRPVSGKEPLADGLLDDVVPFDYSVTVRADGLMGVVRVDGLAAGETRSIKVVLSPSAYVRGVVKYADGTPASGVMVRLVAPAEVDDSPQSMVFTPNTFGSSPERARHEKKSTTADERGAYEMLVEVPGRYLVLVGNPGEPQSESDVFDTSKDAPPPALDLVVALGGTLRGRVIFPDGISPLGRRITPSRTDQQMMFAMMGRRPITLDAEGRFTLGPLDPGAVELRVQGGSGGGSLSLGSVTLVEGETIERTFDYPGGPPAKVTLDLTPTEVDGEQVTAIVDTRIRPVPSVSGLAPKLGPLVIEAGTYELWVAGDGWIACHLGWKVEAGDARTDVLDLDLWSKKVRFVRDGKPLAKTMIELSNAPRDLDGRRFTTDADGCMELRFGSGLYRFGFATVDRETAFLQAVVDWPLGEGVTDIEFRSRR